MTVPDSPYPADVPGPPVPILTKRVVHICDLVVGAKIDEEKARYISIGNGGGGYMKLPVPESAKVGDELTILLTVRVET